MVRALALRTSGGAWSAVRLQGVVRTVSPKKSSAPRRRHDEVELSGWIARGSIGCGSSFEFRASYRSWLEAHTCATGTPCAAPLRLRVITDTLYFCVLAIPRRFFRYTIFPRFSVLEMLYVYRMRGACTCCVEALFFGSWIS